MLCYMLRSLEDSAHRSRSRLDIPSGSRFSDPGPVRIYTAAIYVLLQSQTVHVPDFNSKFLQMSWRSISFGESARLRYRAYRESDLDRLVDLFNDPRIARANPTYMVPVAGTKLRKDLPESFEQALMAIVIEAKEANKDSDDWVGTMRLVNFGSPKNREVLFGILLDPKFWGQGYGEILFRY